MPVARSPLATSIVVLGEGRVEGADVASVVDVGPAVRRRVRRRRGARVGGHPGRQCRLGPRQVVEQPRHLGVLCSIDSTSSVTRRSAAAAAIVCGSGGDAELPALGHRGIPRIRSAIRLRWICDVPAAIVCWSDHR